MRRPIHWLASTILGVAAISITAFACPENTITLYQGSTVHGFCYPTHQGGVTQRWTQVVRACLTNGGQTIAYEPALNSEEGGEQVIGVCQGTFEIRY